MVESWTLVVAVMGNKLYTNCKFTVSCLFSGGKNAVAEAVLKELGKIKLDDIGPLWTVTDLEATGSTNNSEQNAQTRTEDAQTRTEVINEAMANGITQLDTGPTCEAKMSDQSDIVPKVLEAAQTEPETRVSEKTLSDGGLQNGLLPMELDLVENQPVEDLKSKDEQMDVSTTPKKKRNRKKKSKDAGKPTTEPGGSHSTSEPVVEPTEEKESQEVPEKKAKKKRRKPNAGRTKLNAAESQTEQMVGESSQTSSHVKVADNIQVHT
jgi:hypothetical protein